MSQQAGGAIAQRLARYIVNEAMGKSVKFFKMYGQTEATARISAFNAVEMQHKLDSVGFALDNVAVSVDAKYIGEPEELTVAGPSVSRLTLRQTDQGRYEYLPRESELRTGDIGLMDSDGFIYITGRASAILKVSGVRVNANQIEEILRYDRIEEAVAIGLPDPIYGERVGCVLVPAAGSELSESAQTELSNRVAATMSAAAAPVRYWLSDSLPVTYLGKIARHEVAQKYVKIWKS